MQTKWTFSNILRPPTSLKIVSRSPKSNQFLIMSQQYMCASFVLIPNTCTFRNRIQKIHFLRTPVTLKIKLRLPSNSNLLFSSPPPATHTNPPTQQCTCVSLVKPHQSKQEIECRQEATPTPRWTPTGSTPKKTYAPSPAWG